MFGDWKLDCRFRTFVDSALAGSQACESFFSAPVSLLASGPSATTTMTQNTRISHLVRRPLGRRKIERAVFIRIPQDRQFALRPGAPHPPRLGD